MTSARSIAYRGLGMFVAGWLIVCAVAGPLMVVAGSVTGETWLVWLGIGFTVIMLPSVALLAWEMWGRR